MAKKRAVPKFKTMKAPKFGKAPKIETGLYGQGKLKSTLKRMGVLKSWK